MNKAEQVDNVYYTAAWDNNTHSEGCYSLAVHAAWELGGVEVENSNDNQGSKSYAPSITFEFDDSSAVYVSCGGTYVIEPSAWSSKVQEWHIGEVYGTYGWSKILRTRIRVRMAGNDITLRDVISEYAIEQIERDKDARFGIHEQNPRDVPFTP